MGRLLEALRAEVELSATLATPATFPGAMSEVSQSRKGRKGGESEIRPSPGGFLAESQGVPVDSAAVLGRLLRHAKSLGGDPALIRRLPEMDLIAYAGAPDHLLRDFAELMMDSADRHAGRVPAGHTAPIHCAHCGPVWALPSMAAALPVVGGWPRALGCPWCHVRRAGGYIPRPSVTCSGCQYVIPGAINPEAGMRACGAGKGMHWAMQLHTCGNHSPRSLDDKA